MQHDINSSTAVGLQSLKFSYKSINETGGEKKNPSALLAGLKVTVHLETAEFVSEVKWSVTFSNTSLHHYSSVISVNVVNNDISAFCITNNRISRGHCWGWVKPSCRYVQHQNK